jgi:hypothetical protein
MSTDVVIATKRLPGSHGSHAFSARTRRKILAALRDKALAGDPASAEIILRYGLAPVRDRRDPAPALVAVLRSRLNGADGESA